MLKTLSLSIDRSKYLNQQICSRINFGSKLWSLWASFVLLLSSHLFWIIRQTYSDESRWGKQEGVISWLRLDPRTPEVLHECLGWTKVGLQSHIPRCLQCQKVFFLSRDVWNQKTKTAHSRKTDTLYYEGLQHCPLSLQNTTFVYSIDIHPLLRSFNPPSLSN